MEGKQEEKETTGHSFCASECIQWCLAFKGRHFSGSSYSHGTRHTNTWVYFTPNLHDPVRSELIKSFSKAGKVEDEAGSELKQQKLWVVCPPSCGSSPKEILVSDHISILSMEFDEFMHSVMNPVLESSIVVLDLLSETRPKHWMLTNFGGKHPTIRENEEKTGKIDTRSEISKASGVIVLHRLKDEACFDDPTIFNGWMDVKERDVIVQHGIEIIGLTSLTCTMESFPSSFGHRAGPLARDDTQFQYLMNQAGIWKDFETWVGTRKRYLGRNRPRYVSHMVRSMAVQKKKDSEIYDKLFKIIHGVDASASSTGMGSQSIVEHRGAFRADYASSLIEEYLIRGDHSQKQSLRVLDFGCAEGANTRSMAAALKLSPDDIHGCDVRDLTGGLTPTDLGFTFRLLDDTVDSRSGGSSFVLPYESDMFDVVSCQMVLHHITHPIDDVMREFHRVLRKEGIFILREHDCLIPEHEVFFDVIHGMFSLVLSNPREDPRHISTFFAHYRPRSEWMRSAENVGFQCKTRELPVNTEWWNVWRAYYDVFVAL